MALGEVFQRFVDQSPVSVMVRGLIERLLDPQQLDEWFEGTVENQYTRELLFSSVFDIMSQVVCGTRPSVHAAYQATEAGIGVSITSLYNKLNAMAPRTSAELVRYAAAQATPLIEQLGGTLEAPLPGLRVKLLDGNCIEASEHRIEALRALAAGALPGKSLVTYDPQLGIPLDVFPCEDGHAQERSLLQAVLPTVAASEVWIADRNFCTRGFLSGIDARDAYCVIRQHGNLPWEPLSALRPTGKTATGAIFEQWVRVIDEHGSELRLRRLCVRLKNTTRDGDREIYILTNLPKSIAKAKQIAELYRGRWTIETAFQQLTEHLNSEINTLVPYPQDLEQNDKDFDEKVQKTPDPKSGDLRLGLCASTEALLRRAVPARRLVFRPCSKGTGRFSRCTPKRGGCNKKASTWASYFGSGYAGLGYPRAALFGFCVALVSYIILATVKAAMRGVYGAETIEKTVSGYYIAEELSSTYMGMLIAIPEEDWRIFRTLTESQFVQLLRELTEKINLRRFRKHPRGPKKPRPKRISDPKQPHISTARVIANQKRKQ